MEQTSNADKYSYSLNSIQKLNSLNTVRKVPYYANGLSTFFKKQSKNLRTLDKKQCAYKGEIRRNDVRKFIVQDPGLESCARYCKSNSILSQSQLSLN